MRTSTPMRIAASVLLSSLVLAACGQKAGVRVGDEGLAAGQQTGIQTTEGTGQAGTTATTGTATDTGATAGGGATANAGNAGAGAATGGQQQASGGEQQASGGEQQASGGEQQAQGQQASGSNQVIGNDRTGAPEDKIVIGLHAPATGAAPLPTTSFEKARDVYWKYVIGKGEKILGREQVQVLFQDDKYDPNSAGQVCQKLASEAFMVGGGGGTDQIQRCGQLANVGEFPYFSAGVTEAGLTDNPWYFAASMTYRQQGGLLAQYIAKNPDGKKSLGGNAKIGLIITDTPNFKDAEQGFTKGLSDNGLSLAKLGNGQPALFRHTKGDKSWINGVARDFSQAGINTVYFLSAPTIYLDFVNAADSTFNFNPTYVGVGVSKGLNAVLNGGCKEIGSRDDNGIFLSPFPGLDYAEKNIPEFFTASKQFNAPADDIALALWGLAEGQHEIFKRYQAIYGNDLERQTFRAFTESQMGKVETSVYPAVQYSTGSTGHFGANSAHVLEANCNKKQYETLHSFATGF